MKRFLFLLIASVLCFASGCAYLQYRNVLHVSLEGAVGTVNGVEQTIEEGYLNITRDIKNDTWLLSLWFPYDFPFSNQVIYTTEDKAECVNSSYRFAMEDEDGKTSYLIVDAGCYEEGVILIQSQLRWGDSLELRLRDSDNKQIMKIRSRFMKYIFSTYRPSESAMSFIKAADSPSCSPLDTMTVAEDTATIEWDEMVEDEEIPEYYYRSPKAEEEFGEIILEGDFTQTGQMKRGIFDAGWTTPPITYHVQLYDERLLITYADGTSSEFSLKSVSNTGERTYQNTEYKSLSMTYSKESNRLYHVFTDNDGQEYFCDVIRSGNYQSSPIYQQQMNDANKASREQMYLSQYRTWENTVISNYNTLMTMRNGGARASVSMTFRSNQSQMRQVRQNAMMEGISIAASPWETASVPLGYE